MEPADPNLVSSLSLAVALAMVVLGVQKRRLVWRRPRRCVSCRAPMPSCRCRP